MDRQKRTRLEGVASEAQNGPEAMNEADMRGFHRNPHGVLIYDDTGEQVEDQPAEPEDTEDD